MDELSENVHFIRQNAMWVCKKCYRAGGFACSQNCPTIICINCGQKFMHHNGYTPKYCVACCTEKIDDIRKPIRCQRCFSY